jgi:hypothetical protein
VKIIEGGNERNAEKISSSQSIGAISKIKEVDGKFLWK